MSNLFNPDCPKCAQEMGLNGVPPTAPKHRHPVSDPAETLRRALTQCQYCFKCRAEGVKLQKCAGCMIDIYCSKECQKKAWPTHKSKCRLNQLSRTAGRPGQFDVLKDIRAFASKHRPTIAEASLRALQVCVDPSRAFRDVFIIFIQTRSGSTRTETSFFVTGAEVVPFETFGPKADEMREQLKIARDDNLRTSGTLGTVFAVLYHLASGTSNICPIGFPKDLKDVMYAGMPWKERMLNRMNEGIVS